MKRDMELIRKMVLFAEDHAAGFAPHRTTIDGYTPDQIGYHAYLLVDAGLARGSDVTHRGGTGPEWILSHLTSAGHDFADTARAQPIWDEVMADMQKNGVVSTTVDILKTMLDKKLRNRLDVD